MKPTFLLGCEGYLAGPITDLSAFAASSELDDGGILYLAYQSLLDSLIDPVNSLGGAWCADASDTDLWVEVSSTLTTYITVFLLFKV